MKINKATFLFDLDGTLFDSIPTILQSARETFQEISEKYPGDEKLKTLIGSNLQSIFGAFLAKEKVELASQTYRQIYIAKQDAGMIPIFPDTIEVLQYLKNKNFTLGVVTSKKREHSVTLFQQNKIDHFFTVIIGAEDVKQSKPYAEPLLKAVQALGAEIEKTVYIGDALIDREACQNAGMDFIALTTGTTNSDSFQKEGQKIILPNLNSLKIYL